VTRTGGAVAVAATIVDEVAFYRVECDEREFGE
jgi:uncharacterized membrane protein